MHHKCAVVWECLQDLPDSHRNVLLLRGVQELDTNETAEALGVSPGCTKVRLHRARRALRAMLAERSEPRAVFKSLPSGRHAGLGSAPRELRARGLNRCGVVQARHPGNESDLPWPLAAG